MSIRLSELKSLLNRAAAAIETPGDLTRRERAEVAEDLAACAEKISDDGVAEIALTFHDGTEELPDTLDVRLRVGPLGLVMAADGYGVSTMLPGAGEPLFVELYEGRLRAAAWTDINQEDPTEVFNFDEAREEARKGQDLRAVLTSLLTADRPPSGPVVLRMLNAATNANKPFDPKTYEEPRLVLVNAAQEHAMMVLGGERPGTREEFDALHQLLLSACPEDFEWQEPAGVFGGFSFGSLADLIAQQWQWLINEGGENASDVPKLRPILDGLLAGDYIDEEQHKDLIETLADRKPEHASAS